MKIIFKVRAGVPSENFIYRPAIGRGHAYLYLDPDVERYEGYIQSYVSETMAQCYIYPHIVFDNVSMVYIFMLSDERYWESDVTNCIKATEDGIIKGLKPYYPQIDDKHTVIATQVKTRVPLRGDEGFYAIMQVNTGGDIIQRHIETLQSVQRSIHQLQDEGLNFSQIYWDI
jgi:hypothetical protein